MKIISPSICITLIVALTACGKLHNRASTAADEAAESSVPTEGNGQHTSQPGVITAAEWNDLYHWDFWQKTIESPQFESIPAQWSFYNQHRISVQIHTTNGEPVANALVALKKKQQTIFTARTDNEGKAELWPEIFQQNTTVDYSGFQLDINNGSKIVTQVRSFDQGVNKIELSPISVENSIEISFVVDATGSMGDELEFLKTELLDVIDRVKKHNPKTPVLTSSVFYRDEGDDYITRVSPFTNNENETLNFIKKQNASGGGDYPEAVHTALDKAINELQWTPKTRTKILFLLLDAPPHENKKVITSIQASTLTAAEKGIKIIPVTASGIDKPTEFLMRFLALSTNGTYVFITNDSGIGNNHLEATVGDYQVEYLNNLMVRLINKYAK